MTIKNVTNHGTISLVYSLREHPMIEFTVNMDSPTGGVQLPMVTTVQTIRPKWTGSIPSAMAEGNRSGERRSTAAFVSMNIPARNKIIFIKP